MWRNGIARAYTHFAWNEHCLKIVKASFGSCKGRTAFEFLILFVCTVAFGEVLADTGALIRGDNLGSFNVTLDLSSITAAMNIVAREIAWRRIVLRWQNRLKHLPAGLNDEADALSPLQAVPPMEFPQTVLSEARLVEPPVQEDSLWRARLEI